MKKELLAAYVAKLAASGLDAQDAEVLNFTVLDSSETAQLKLPAFCGFKIPYFDTAGNPTSFYRIRYLENTNTQFQNLTDAKPLRYIQPPETINEVYFPPLGPFTPWNKYLTTDGRIVITEGELKAACATKHGYPTIGLGGVWMFKSKALSNIGFLPALEAINWKDRPVTVIFDSDALSNPHVLLAENTLAKALTARAAIPSIVRLPALDGKKTGLDDFLTNPQGGAEALQRLITAAEPFSIAQALHEMNENVIYVADPSLIFDLQKMRRMSVKTFVNEVYANRKHNTVVFTKAGSKNEERATAREWIKWEHRAQVERITYAPGQPRVFDNQLNIWSGWGVTPKEGDILPWKQLLQFLFRGEPEAQLWFEQWLAYPLQNPGVKMFSAAVLWGLAQGTGKSLVGYTMFRIYGDNATEIRERDLQERHNEWAENKQFVMGEEITGGDKRGIADRMKSMITQQKLRLNPKYIPTYEVPDCINYYFTSNHPDAFFLEDHDRRFFVHEIKGQPYEKNFYANYERWLKNGGAEALFYYFLHMDLSTFDAKGHAHATKSKSDMLDLGRSDLGSWVSALKENPDTVLRIGEHILSFALWRAEDLLRIYDPDNRGKVTANGLSRELRRSGFVKTNKGMGCFTKDGQVRLWAIRNTEVLSNLDGAALGKYYDDEREISKKNRKF